MQAYAGPVAKWSNAMLGQPEPHMIDLMVAAAQNQTVADAFARFFEKANEAWNACGSPEGAADFRARHGWQSEAMQVAA